MRLEFQIAKLICETKNKDMLNEIFGSDNTTEILERGLDDLIKDIETAYGNMPRKLKYGEIVFIKTSSRPALFVNRNSNNQANVLTSIELVTVSIDNIQTTGRILWLNELNNEYDSDGLPITTLDIDNDINTAEKLTQLLRHGC